MSWEAAAAQALCVWIVVLLVFLSVSAITTWMKQLMYVDDPTEVQLGLGLVQACLGSRSKCYGNPRPSVPDGQAGKQVFHQVWDMAGRMMTVTAAVACCGPRMEMDTCFGYARIVER